MIYYFDSSVDMFSFKKADYLVNPVNAIGVPGAGVAKLFARKYPTETAEYIKYCKNTAREFAPSGGDIYINGRVIFFFTKSHYYNPSRIEWIDSGLDKMANYFLLIQDPKMIVMPAIGCGLGGLEWSDVRESIDNSWFCSSHHKLIVIEPREMYGQSRNS